MELGCTIPLMRRERWNGLPAAAQRELLFCWDVHALPLRGRLALVGTNSATRFAFVRWDWRPGGKDALVETVCRAIDESLAAANASEAMRKTYRAAAGTPCLSRTHGRRPVAFLNRMVETLLQNDGLLDLEQQAQPFLEAALNAMPCRAAEDMEKSALVPAAERMTRALAALSCNGEKEKTDDGE